MTADNGKLQVGSDCEVCGGPTLVSFQSGHLTDACQSESCGAILSFPCTVIRPPKPEALPAGTAWELGLIGKENFAAETGAKVPKRALSPAPDPTAPRHKNGKKK